MVFLLVMVVIAIGLLLVSLNLSERKPSPKIAKSKSEGEESGLKEEISASSKEGEGEITVKAFKEKEKVEEEITDKKEFWKETADILQKLSFLKGSSEDYYRPIKRNPMEPASYVATRGKTGPFSLIIKEEPLHLTGILLDEGKKAAIIDEKIVRIGDTIAGKKIVTIEKGRVVLRKGQEEEILTLAR